MTTSKKWIACFAIPGLVALVVGLPAASRASTPTTAVQAQALAQRSHVRAQKAEALGGVGYKSGDVQRAETDEARYTAKAEALSPLMALPPPPTPMADHYARVAQHYRAMAGGPAYKWRRVQQAEMEQRHWARIETQADNAFLQPGSFQEPPPPVTYPACDTVSKPDMSAFTCRR